MLTIICNVNSCNVTVEYYYITVFSVHDLCTTVQYMKNEGGKKLVGPFRLPRIELEELLKIRTFYFTLIASPSNFTRASRVAYL